MPELMFSDKLGDRTTAEKRFGGNYSSALSLSYMGRFPRHFILASRHRSLHSAPPICRCS
jgi:hypothetical protein